MIQLVLAIIAFIIVDTVIIWIFQKIDLGDGEKKFWINTAIVLLVLGVEHFYFIEFVITELKYFELNFLIIRNPWKDALFLALGFMPEILLLAAYSLTEKVAELEMT